MEVLWSEVVRPAAVLTMLICGLLLPAGMAFYVRRWAAGVGILALLAIAAIAFLLSPLAAGIVWLVALAAGCLTSHSAKRDAQHRELMAALKQANPPA